MKLCKEMDDDDFLFLFFDFVFLFDLRCCGLSCGVVVCDAVLRCCGCGVAV